MICSTKSHSGRKLLQHRLYPQTYRSNFQEAQNHLQLIRPPVVHFRLSQNVLLRAAQILKCYLANVLQILIDQMETVGRIRTQQISGKSTCPCGKIFLQRNNSKLQETLHRKQQMVPVQLHALHHMLPEDFPFQAGIARYIVIESILLTSNQKKHAFGGHSPTRLPRRCNGCLFYTYAMEHIVRLGWRHRTNTIELFQK